MTPALTAVYEELLRLASTPPFVERADALREAFFARTGGRPSNLGESHSLGARMGSAWDAALTQGGLASDLAERLEDPSERALARVLGRAHRGVFRLERHGVHTVVRDHVSGATFLLLARDDVGRELLATGEDDAFFDGRVVAARDGASFLPGVIFHPPDAAEPIETVLAAGNERGMAREDVCDALLRMEYAFRALSRVKIAYAYRPQALVAASLTPSTKPA